MIIILDTNFLIYLIKHRLAEQFKEIGGEPVLLSSVEKELKKPTFGAKERAFGAAALELSKVWGIKALAAKLENVDDSIVEAAKELKRRGKDVQVATVDAGLIRRLKNEGISAIVIKRGKIVSRE
jgi:rRNA-processing protein FCF1